MGHLTGQTCHIQDFFIPTSGYHWICVCCAGTIYFGRNPTRLYDCSKALDQRRPGCVGFSDVGQCAQLFSKANITYTGDEDCVEEVLSAANENRLVFNCINPPAGFFYLGLQILRDETRLKGTSCEEQNVCTLEVV